MEKKSVIAAYLLWLFLGSIAMHRFYLGRPMTALMQLMLIWGGALLAWVNAPPAGEELPDLVLLGWGIAALGAGWVIVIDLFMTAVIVKAHNREAALMASDYRQVDVYSVDMTEDPRIAQAQLAARKRPDGKRRGGIPDDYVMPWRREDEDEPKGPTYRTGED